LPLVKELTFKNPDRKTHKKAQNLKDEGCVVILSIILTGKPTIFFRIDFHGILVRFIDEDHGFGITK